MITRGAPESASAPASPSSRATAAPSDCEPPTDTAVVVDVTGGEEPWTATSARRTSDPPPLRSSKRASARNAPDTAPSEARKGKKKATKRPTAIGSAAKPLDPEAACDSDSELEEKTAPPPTKKTKKTAAPSTPAPAEAKRPAPAEAKRPAPAEAKRPVGPRSDQGFDLTTFMASFQPGRGGTGEGPSQSERGATTARPGRDVASELQALRDEVARLRGLVGDQGPPARDPTRVGATTEPNTRGEMPPAELCQLTSASFPEGAKKAKGDYKPPQAHLLAASRMFRAFGTETGKPLSAMSFVLWLRELERVKVPVTPAVLMAIFSGRLGSRGLTVMHFKESSAMETLEDGSTNANYSSDFSATAALPTASIRCSTYEDILDAIHGLSALGQEVWYDHMRKLTSRLRVFVAKNKSADPTNTPARVRLTLLYVNKFVGTALGHMQADDPQWWSGFCEALRSIDYQSPAWTMALLSTLTQGSEGDRRQGQARGRRDNEGRREGNRRPAIPDAIRRLIPMNRRGQEPCLLNVAGLPCSGGTRERCGNPRRVHNWSETLLARVQEWIDHTYGARSAANDERR